MSGYDADALRREFDAAFAAPAELLASDQVELLLIKVAGRPYALRLTEISGLMPTRKIVALPTRVSELIGIVGLRGGLVPIYQLAGLLGHEDRTGQALPWLILVGAPDPVGLMFDVFEGHVRARGDQLMASAGDGRAIPTFHLRRAGEPPRPVVEVAAVIEAIERRARGDRANKEAAP